MSNQTEDNVMGKYEQIIDLPHYEPRHRRMPLYNRASDEGAAVTGCGGEVGNVTKTKETAKDYDRRDTET